MTARSDVVEMMRALPVLVDAPDRVVRDLASIARVIRVDEGTLLFAEGDKHSELYFVATGTIKLDMVTAQCGKQQILTVGAGDFLAWSAFLGDGRMTASAVAAEESCLVALSANQLRELCEANHDVGYIVAMGIAKLIARRLLATRLQLLDLYHI